MVKRYGTSSMECENGIYVLHAEGNVPQTVEGWDGGCGIDYATLRSWSMLDFEGERFRAAAST
uniref:hypothetical protein n=1 Tax=Paraburkholderia phenoliruptrix TaxID=252970 RepID=UPI001ABAFAF6